MVVHKGTAHALALVEHLNDTAPCPVVLLLDAEDPPLVHDALARGVTAYTDRPTPGALQNAIELARRHFDELHRLGRQMHDLEAGAERRAVIERAKGAVLERHGVDERKAYALLRGRARDDRVTLAEVAIAVLHARNLQGVPAPGNKLAGDGKASATEP